MQEMQIAVVGLGAIARTHVAALRALPAMQAAAVLPVLHTLVTRRPEQVRAEARAMGFARVTDSLEEVLSDSTVDAVDICTPNSVHRSAVETALAAGKAVYCEKPLAAAVADAEAMAAAAAAADVPTQVALVYRYHPAVLRVKALLERAAIGDLLQFRAAFRHSSYLNAATAKGWRSQQVLSGGGALLDLGVHVLDVLHLLLGPLALDHAAARTLVPARPVAPGEPPVAVEVEDWALLHLHTAGGVPGVVETSRIALGSEGVRLEIYGTGGSITCDLARDMEPAVRAFGPVPGPAPEPARRYLPPPRQTAGLMMDLHQAGLLHFMLRCTGADPTPGWAPTFADSLAAERLVHAALSAAHRT